MAAAFEMVVVGCGGGPDETNLSSYLLKTYDASWADGILTSSAGSGAGALNYLLKNDPHLFDLDEKPDAAEPVVQRTWTATLIYACVRCADYLITHAHNDHISSLIISAGSHLGERKRICALPSVIQYLTTTVFNDKLWPCLGSCDSDDDPHKYFYSTLEADGEYTEIGHGLSVRAMPVSHGCTSGSELYGSTAFFIRNRATDREFLFFGDVEPDSISKRPQTHAVWRAAARLIPDKLDTIFLECSYPESRPNAALYGHLSPQHVVAELRTLAKEVVEARERRASDASFRSSVSQNGSNGSESPGRPRKRAKVGGESSNGQLTGALKGVTLHIIHCKQPRQPDDEKRPIAEVIVGQIRRALLVDADLGVQVAAVHQGMKLVF
ncbi:cyclic-AMP phosphodiesterase [Auricularia subglabra TFB-10046 SS5]|nr:cyclic-AMP phosphodiesterase [Auricularia subglabra TFB-10046 SS5]